MFCTEREKLFWEDRNMAVAAEKLSEIRRAVARSRWAALTPEQRRAATEKARAARWPQSTSAA
jgi:hypothetical protein